MYNISLTTTEICYWYNIHYQFISNGYSSLTCCELWIRYYNWYDSMQLHDIATV